MVNQNKVNNPQTGRSPLAILSAQFTFTNVSQVGHRQLGFQPIPNRGLEVPRKGGAELPSRSFAMRQFVGGESCARAPLRVHG